MNRALVFLLACCWGFTAQAFTLTLSSRDFQVVPIFSDVRQFYLRVDIDEPLTRRIYNNPRIANVRYQVSGDLAFGTPSGFSRFNLQRNISGDEFYRQGSSLHFQISETAILRDGVQVAELVGSSGYPGFTLDAREVDSGRYHPVLLQLNAFGNGSMRNSDNIPRLNPRIAVDFGQEYISNLFFDAGNLTIIDEYRNRNSGFYVSGGAFGLFEIYCLGVAFLLLKGLRRKPTTRQR